MAAPRPGAHRGEHAHLLAESVTETPAKERAEQAAEVDQAAEEGLRYEGRTRLFTGLIYTAGFVFGMIRVELAQWNGITALAAAGGLAHPFRVGDAQLAVEHVRVGGVGCIKTRRATSQPPTQSTSVGEPNRASL